MSKISQAGFFEFPSSYRVTWLQILPKIDFIRS